MKRFFAAVLVASSLSAVLISAATAGAADPPMCDTWFGHISAGGRIRIVQVPDTHTYSPTPNPNGTRELVVLVPPGYDDRAASARRYPVLYLLNGGFNNAESWVYYNYYAPDVVSFTAAEAAAGKPAIVVWPDGKRLGIWTDWRDGHAADETLFTKTIIPFVDGHFRTIADRAHRAIAGVSGGGFGASHLATRHPDLFAALGAFSGLDDIVAHTAAGDLLPMGIDAGAKAIGEACDGDLSHLGLSGPFGDPLTDPVWTHDANPTDLAGNLTGLSTVYLASGNGVPCDADDVRFMATFMSPTGVGPLAIPLLGPGAIALELASHQLTSNFDAALSAAGIAHTFESACGIHYYRYFQRMLTRFWAPMFNAFAHSFVTPPPSFAFDYRSAAPRFSVWDWTFRADPTRAPEFLDVKAASSSGLQLEGSGMTAVTTARIFHPLQAVTLTINGVTTVRNADPRGRLTFTVDLGVAHTLEQYTTAEQALETFGSYFTKSVVTFR